VGREAEQEMIAARLADPACRLLVLLGLGGSGKTSLALRAAAAQVRPAALPEEHPFADGVYLVDLAAHTLPRTRSAERAQVARRLMATAIGRVLGLEFRGADPVAHLASRLRERALLLVLDNMEHLLEGAALLAQLLEQSPRLKLLVTTRERLHLPAEWVVEVRGLPLPDGPDELEQAPASSLYLQLMRQAGASGRPDAAERADIARICTLMQGLPLALVLAARWTPRLSAAAIVRELEAGLDLLTAHGPQGSERQRSMRTVLKWTWGRLTTEERAAMRRLSVFQSGFTREAAGAVAGARLPLLLLLDEHGLIGRDPAAERHAMHEFVRQYAAEQLAGDAEEETVTRQRHAAFYAALVQQATPALRQTVAAQEVISAEFANIRAAWDWAAERVDAAILEQMLEGMAKWYELQGLMGQSSEALDRAAVRLRDALAQAITPDPSVQRLLGFVLVEEAISWSWQGAHRRAMSLFEEARELARVTASGSPRRCIWRGVWPIALAGSLCANVSCPARCAGPSKPWRWHVPPSCPTWRRTHSSTWVGKPCMPARTRRRATILTERWRSISLSIIVLVS
jgi:predicted ATPase